MPPTPQQRDDKHRMLVLVEDDLFIIELWKRRWTSDSLVVFRSPTECLEALRAGPDWLTSVGFVVTDYIFTADAMNGIELARLIHELHPTWPIFSASDSGAPRRQASSSFRGHLEKRAYAPAELLRLYQHSIGATELAT